ncbi:hypothetical protein chiPu_0021840, partial [Chiloscyllium punctatum]|nr:hypothetical protein [Chiloscyllium punctatum]
MLFSTQTTSAQTQAQILKQLVKKSRNRRIPPKNKKRVEDVTLVAACAPPSGARTELSQRLLKHFSIFTLPQPSTNSLQHIFQVQIGCHLESQNFLPVVQKCRELLVTAAIAIYYKMCRQMLPTPVKPHYTFNMRDLAKVAQGLLQAHESEIASREKTIILFAHEVSRVFHDRLSDEKDRQMFYTFLSDDLHNYFK